MDPNTLVIWKNLETRLDVPFRNNMMALLLEMARERTADPQKIATWMLTTSACICNAVFGINDPVPLLSLYIRVLCDHYPRTMEQIAQIYSYGSLKRYVPVIADRDEFIGILSAAGSTFANGELILTDGEIDVSQKGLERFQLIWKAPAMKLENPGPSVLW
ncbi:hypothetical protein [Acaryochloris marina]|uniref:Uncharacterized protein n=1 Tax=Acaryochloris marina (strain MBIC 11017) TaxID=329726 RepID=A8ZN86_ACAM1|nr:hypothetical protein [Acaryochloris marina]ABW32285.1 hypothetical protein AM1_C0358 [Acaryochloris marina MBIC11017]